MLLGKITQVETAKFVDPYCVFGSVFWSNGGQLLQTVRSHICLRCSILTENLEKLAVGWETQENKWVVQWKQFLWEIIFITIKAGLSLEEEDNSVCFPWNQIIVFW